MPHFLCCSASFSCTVHRPVSHHIPPEDKLLPVRSSPGKVKDDSGINVHTGNAYLDKDAYNPPVLLNEAQLPGQMPDSPRDAAFNRTTNPAEKKGVPLLEETLSCSTNSRLHQPPSGILVNMEQPCPAEQPSPAAIAAPSKLRIPLHLQGSSASFSLQYRNSEQLLAPNSFIHPLQQHSSSARSSDLLHSRCSRRHFPVLSSNPESLWHMAEPPFLRCFSRKSETWRLYRHFQLSYTHPDSGQNEALGSGGSLSTAASAFDARAGLTAAAAAATGSAGCVSPSAVREAALCQLQRELDVTESLPCCPLLLLPHRVYEQSDAMYVVYDSEGEYEDLYTFLRARQRLSEGACRSIMRQLLQALSVLHERRWVHRNISSETVWVVDAQSSRPVVQMMQPPGDSLHQNARGQEEMMDAIDVLNGSPASLRQQSYEAASEGPHAHHSASAAATSGLVMTSETLESWDTLGSGFHGVRSSTAGQGPHVWRGISGGWIPAIDNDSPQAHAYAPEPEALRPPRPPSQLASPPRRSSSHESCRNSDSSIIGSSALIVRSPQRRCQQPQLRVKLGGLAQVTRQPLDAGWGQELPLRDLLGCVYHLAPEAINGAGYGRPADVWAAGVLMYMLLTGRPPFPGRNELEVMTHVLLATSSTEPTRDRQGSTSHTAAAAAILSRATPPTPPTAHQESTFASGACPSQQLPGQPEPQLQHSLGQADTLASRRRASAGDCCDGDGGSQRPSHPVGASTGTARFSGQTHALRELIVQAVVEAHASAACRDVLTGMLVSDPEGRLTVAQLLRLPWFVDTVEGD